MKTIYKVFKTLIAFVLLAGATFIFCILDSTVSLAVLMGLVVAVFLGFAGGISILVNTYPNYFNESEYDWNDNTERTDDY